MTSRTEKEMTALLVKFKEQIGPFCKWSDTALEMFNTWLVDTGAEITHEWVKRDSDRESDS
jgi:hypothetical protein